MGPAIAGILVASIGEGWCFFVNARQLHRGDRRAADDARRAPARRGARRRRWHTSIEGFRFVRRTAPIRALLLLLGLVSLVGMPYAVLMPIFADRILHGGRARPRHSDGRHRRRRAGGRADRWRRENGVRGLGRWVAFVRGGFGVSLMLFSLVAHVLAVGAAAGPGRALR